MHVSLYKLLTVPCSEYLVIAVRFGPLLSLSIESLSTLGQQFLGLRHLHLELFSCLL